MELQINIVTFLNVPFSKLILLFISEFRKQRYSRMPVCDWERTITCPYNPSHQITVERIQWHLVKCRKNYPSSDHVICPFNASHHVPRPEKEYHMSVCSDRKMVEMEKYSLRSNSVHQQGNVNLPPSVVSDLPPCEEDWEKEATVRKSYDPSAKAKQSAVLRKLEGATPSQRKEFRAQERERLDLLNLRKEATGTGGRPSHLVPRKENYIPGLVIQETLRRPTLSGNEWEGSSTECRSSLLATHMGRGSSLQKAKNQLRRPGSLVGNISLDTSAASCNGLATSLDTTKDTLDHAIDAVGNLTLGRGKKMELKGREPLRRPSIGRGAPIVSPK